MNDNNEFNDIGYGKPPQHTRFKRGKSGNPKGRPKGRLNMATELYRILRERIVITENGKTKTVTKQQAAIKQLVNKALSGDLRALQLLQVLACSAEEKTLEAGPSAIELTDADQQVVESIRRRIEAARKGAKDDESDPK